MIPITDAVETQSFPARSGWITWWSIMVSVKQGGGRIDGCSIETRNLHIDRTAVVPIHERHIV